MKLRSIALGSVASLALFAGGAIAADLPVRTAAPAPFVMAPVMTWSGFYVGAALGGVSSEADGRWNEYELISTFGDGSATLNQFTVGGYLGYNFQFGNFVVGLEGDLNARFGNENLSLGLIGLSLGTARAESDWDASIRLRLGFLVTPRALIYATGGVAFADYSAGWRGIPEVASIYAPLWNLGGNRTGWTIGAGFEYALDANWHLKLEYLYADYGSESFTFQDPTLRRSVDITSNTVRVGVSYRFGGSSSAPVVARY